MFESSVVRLALLAAIRCTVGCLAPTTSRFGSTLMDERLRIGSGRDMGTSSRGSRMTRDGEELLGGCDGYGPRSGDVMGDDGNMAARGGDI